MATTVKCPKCAAPIPTAGISAGGDVQCPSCGKLLKVKGSRRADEAAGAKASKLAAKDGDGYALAAEPAFPDALAASGESLAVGDLSQFGAPATLAPLKKKAAAGDEASGPKKSRKRKSKTKDQGLLGSLPPKTLVLCAGGGGLALLVVIVGLVLALRGNGEQRVAAANAGGAASLSATAAIVDTPEPGVSPPPPVDQTNSRPSPPEGPPVVRTQFAILPPVGDDAVVGGDPSGSWAGAVDPAKGEALKLPDDVAFHYHSSDGSHSHGVLFASQGGPFAVETWTQDRSGLVPLAPLKDPVGETKGQSAAVPVHDLRTGEAVGRFVWNAPFWRPTRLSPEGLYLVGPENSRDVAGTRLEGHLYVWKREEPAPVGRLTAPGPVIWMDFVAPDRFAFLTFDPEPVLQIWDVVKAELVQTIALPKEEFSRPTRDPITNDANLTRVTFAPNPWTGAASPGGRYLFLAGNNAIVAVSLTEGREVGALPLPLNKLKPGPADRSFDPYPGNGEYRGVGVSEDGATLRALIRTSYLNLVSWSLNSGKPTSVVQIGTAEDARRFYGPPVDGPSPETVLLPRYNFGSWLAGPLTVGGGSSGAGALVDMRTGVLLGELDFLPVRWLGKERLLALGNLALAPNVPQPPWDASDLSKLSPEKLTAWRKKLKAAITIPSAELAARAAAEPADGKSLPEPRPPVQIADRSGVEPIVPEPPKTWSAPPAPAAVEKLVGARDIPNTQPLIGDVHVSFLHGWPTLDGIIDGKWTFAEGLYWHRYDMRTGQPSGSPLRLWPWATSPLRGTEINLTEVMVAAALSPDGARLALRDPGDLARVDVWEESGERILGWHPYGAAIPVQWVGWSKQGRLLTVGDGKLTGWDASACKAVFEGAGDYRLPVAPVRDRAWLAIVGGSQVDLLDADSGHCLGRLPLTGAELPDVYPDLAVSPDGQLLAYCGRRTDDSPAQLTPHRAAVLLAWDLTTGKAHEPLPVMREPGWSIAAIDNQRVSVQGLVYDLRCRVGVVRFPSMCLPASPDGRLWAIGPHPEDEGKPPRPWFNRPGERWKTGNETRSSLRPVEFVDLDKGPASPQEIFTPQTPITIEVDLGKAELSQTLAHEQAALLQRDGFTVGKSAWRLKAAAEIFDSGVRFTNGTHLPAVRVNWQFLAPDGTAAPWKQNRTFLFQDVAWKYGAGEEVIGQAGPFQVKVLEKFDFGGRNPREVLTADMLEKAQHAVAVEGFPPQVGPFAGRYQILPAAGEVRYPPMSP